MEKKLNLNSRQNKKLKKLATKAKVPPDEILRRAIDAYDLDTPTDMEWKILFKLLEKSQKKTIKAVEKAREHIRQTLNSLSKHQSDRINYNDWKRLI